MPFLLVTWPALAYTGQKLAKEAKVSSPTWEFFVPKVPYLFENENFPYGRRRSRVQVPSLSPFPLAKSCTGLIVSSLDLPPRLRTERGFNPGSHAAAVWPRRMGAQESERLIPRFTRMWRRI
jgi:hypothetical protein